MGTENSADRHALSAARNTSALVALFWLSGCCSAVSTQRIAAPCTSNTGPAIPKFCIATPDVLWGGGRPDKDDAAWLIQQGIRTIVDLELTHDDRSALAHATLADTNTYTVDYFRVHDWEPLPMIAPSIEDDRVAHFLAIVSRAPAPVYAHCRCGMKRTAVMIAAYRVIVEGVTGEKAIAGMSRYGGPWSGPDSRYILSLARRRDEMRRRVAEWIPKLERDARIVCTGGKCSILDH
jgi:protein tyrosine phosphatase (PTP) superfamily phosphohydrolase (DUF442 family)